MAAELEKLIEEIQEAQFASDNIETITYVAKLLIVNNFHSVKQLASNDFDGHWVKRLVHDDEETKCTAGTAALIKQIIARQTKLLEMSIHGNAPTILPEEDTEGSQSFADSIGLAITKALAKEKKVKHDIHIDLNAKMNELQIKDLQHDLWPKADSVNHLANQKASLQDQGVFCPFVNTKLKYFLPIWALEKPSDLEMLHVNMWSPAFLRYAIAADAVNMVPLALSMQHHDLCMRLTHELGKSAKKSFIACAYDNAVRESLAEKSKANWNVSLNEAFSKIDRDLLERALVNLDKVQKKPEAQAVKAFQWKEGHWNSKSQSSSWKSNGQKRKYDNNSDRGYKYGKY